MDLNVINQLGRTTFLPQENIQYLNPFRYQSTNPVPSFAFGAQPLTSSFIALPKDELEIVKVMEFADQPSITVVDQTFKTTEKVSATDLKVGAGTMKPDIEEAFSKPVYKVKEVSVSNATTTSTKRQLGSGSTTASTSSTAPATKKFKSRGIKFV